MVKQREAAKIVARDWKLNEKYDIDYCERKARELCSGEGKKIRQVFDVLSVNYPNRTKRERRKDENVDIFFRIGNGKNRMFRLYDSNTDGSVEYQLKIRN